MMRLRQWSTAIIALVLILVMIGTGSAQEGTEEPVAEKATATPTETATATPTETPSSTPTETPTEVPTETPSVTPASETPTSEATFTETPTETLTETPTLTPTLDLTITVTSSHTATATPEYITRVDEFGIAQVWVPAGCFMMVISDKEIELAVEYVVDYVVQTKHQPRTPELVNHITNALLVNTPEHQICFEAGFWIDKYEVTNQAYQVFIDAGGYKNSQYWSVLGWDWLMQENISGPENYEGYNAPLQPRVGISWYEAQAYANWRGGQLPSEAQWEYAASGSNNYAYPWGNEFVPTNLNFCDIHCVTDWAHPGDDGVELTELVGHYESGKSWVGAYDMSGNAEEWTSSLIFPYPYQSNEANTAAGIIPRADAYVHRRGDFFDDLMTVRADFRDAMYPHWRDRHSGVRIIKIQ